MSGVILAACVGWQVWRLSRAGEPTTADKLAMAYIALGFTRLAARAVGP